MIPACNVDSRVKEISNVVVWSRANNLKLNHAKSAEIIFRDNRKRRCIHPPSPLQGIARVTSLKVLGVTLTDGLSVTPHVDDAIAMSARSMYAICVLRSHGLEASALQQVFRAVVVTKLTYAAPAWWGFTTSAEQQRIDAVLRRAARSDLWTSAGTSLTVNFHVLMCVLTCPVYNKMMMMMMMKAKLADASPKGSGQQILFVTPIAENLIVKHLFIGYALLLLLIVLIVLLTICIQTDWQCHLCFG